MKTQSKRALNAPATKGDLDDAVGYIVSSVGKTLEENYPTKDDLNDGLNNLKVELRKDIKRVKG